MIVMHDIHSTSGIPSKYLKTNISSSNIESFAVDAKSDIIYFLDSESTSLKKYDIITLRTSTIVSTSSARGNNWILSIALRVTFTLQYACIYFTVYYYKIYIAYSCYDRLDFWLDCKSSRMDRTQAVNYTVFLSQLSDSSCHLLQLAKPIISYRRSR